MNDRTFDFKSPTDFGSDMEKPIRDLLAKIQAGTIHGYALLFVEPHPTDCLSSVVRERLRGSMSPRDMVMAIDAMQQEMIDRATSQQEDANATLPKDDHRPLKLV